MLPALGHCRVAFCTSDSLLAACLKQLFEAWQVQHEAYADRQSLLAALQGPVNWTHLLLDHHLLPAAGLALPADVQGLALVPLGAEAEAALKNIPDCELQIVNNGQEALDYLQTQAVDLVLMDLQMPVMDGLEAMQAIRSRPELAHLPVIAATAHAFSEDRENSLKAGFSDYIAKPFLPEDLVQMVQRWRPENLSQA